MTKTILGTVLILLLITLYLSSFDKNRAYDPILTTSATLNFGNTGPGASSDLTISVTGAALNDPVALGVPNGSVVTTGCFTAWISASNTVTVRYTNSDGILSYDPASGTFKVSVLKN